MYLVITILPFIGCCIAGITGRFIGSIGAVIITTSCIIITIIFSIISFYEVALCRSSVSVNLAC